ncbi:MAG: hypothetical protein K8S13_12080 [Desulfobacula sp.]|uniref:hypothetical protein n=1 Tax=Desulfobacula sp. TaxID=2593537 RepID=UPI0025C20DB1|nr:hypothetical protein [Desulfobacula sp.]MCD4720578.1 hypothetical protein [Desulfobacula sp.]
MTKEDPNNQIKYSTVGISDECISEYDGKIEKIKIPINQIIRISLLYGNPIERPIGHLFVCLVLWGIGFGLGLWPLYTIVTSGESYDSVYSFKIFCMAAPLILLGCWFFIRFFQKRYYFSVETNNDKRKIVFENSEDKQEIKSFTKQVNKKYGLQINSLTEL